jgi:LmbE family N-acetylglucosaminyl deacetylase
MSGAVLCLTFLKFQMKILYIFPHPDDESYGPAGAMFAQKREGHEVHLLTLTKGGATKERFRLGLSVEEMGALRVSEMHEVAKVLELSSLSIWDWTDSGMQDMDPRIMEKEIANFILELKPEVVVTYPVHGISGFHDHLICHAIVKRVFLDLKENPENHFLKRLAFHTIPDDGSPIFLKGGYVRMKHSVEDRIDCEVSISEEAFQKNLDALDCYKSYQAVIEISKIKEKIGKTVHYEFFQEVFSPRLKDISAEI